MYSYNFVEWLWICVNYHVGKLIFKCEQISTLMLLTNKKWERFKSETLDIFRSIFS